MLPSSRENALDWMRLPERFNLHMDAMFLKIPWNRTRPIVLAQVDNLESKSASSRSTETMLRVLHPIHPDNRKHEALASSLTPIIAGDGIILLKPTFLASPSDSPPQDRFGPFYVFKIKSFIIGKSTDANAQQTLPSQFRAIPNAASGLTWISANGFGCTLMR